jgi:hypothetical protein
MSMDLYESSVVLYHFLERKELNSLPARLIRNRSEIMIKTIRIKNFKSIKEQAIENLPPIIGIWGKNVLVQ